MNKYVLSDYIDACALVKETQKDIARLQKQKRTIVTDKVKGSMNDFPYAETHFKVEGTPYTYSDDVRIRAEEVLLHERQQKAEEVKLAVEKWLCAVPMRMQRIIRHHFFDGLSWEETADRMGRKATGESMRKEFERFMSEK